MTHTKPPYAAPAFTLSDAHGNPVSLSDFKGKYVLIYFYPRAATPGCTAQACALNEGLGALEKLKVHILGISPDPQPRLARFAETYGLQFPLLSDETRAVTKAYGAWGLKTNYGKTTEGLVRSSFAIDPQGSVLHVWRNVKPATHYDDVYTWFVQHFSA